MHTGCLGVVLWLLGAVLWELAFDGPFNGRLEARRDQLWALIQAKYRDLDVPTSSRIADVDIERFRHAHCYAELRSKAVQARHLLPVVADLGAESRRDIHRLAALDHLTAIYDVYAVADEVLSETVHEELMEHVEGFLLEYNWLAHRSMSRGELCYPFTSKFHYVWHIVHQSLYLNPRFTWCYPFESFIGKICRTAQACLAGTPCIWLARRWLQIMWWHCMSN